MAKKNLKIIMGSTFSEVFRWESPKSIYRPITNVANSAPLNITCPDHGMPSAWRGRLSNIVGTTELNSTNYLEFNKIDKDTLEVNSINSSAYKPYISAGTLEYPEPINLTGYTAKMQVRSNIDSPVVLIELSTENGGIVIDTTACTISMNITALATSNLTWTAGVYSLVLFSNTDQTISNTTHFLEGTVTIIKEVTR